MEPRPHERGNLNPNMGALAARRLLQWSHVLTNVETPTLRRWLALLSPLQWSHVLTNVETPQPMSAPAASRICFNGATSSRTWKRVLLDATERGYASLQWSHVLTNVETRPAPIRARARSLGFNGATSSRTWKPSRSGSSS